MLNEGWVYWVRGMYGPNIVVSATKTLTHLDKQRKLCEPTKLKDDEVSLSLDELAKLYPAPPVPEN